MRDRAYLTISEAATELGTSEAVVERLIAREELFALRRGDCNALVPRPSFDAHIRRRAGAAPLATEHPRAQGELLTRLADFERDAGKTPQQWLADWTTAGPHLDTAENMALTVSATGLVAELLEVDAHEGGFLDADQRRDLRGKAPKVTDPSSFEPRDC